jgi:hypothetical protein
MKVKDISTRIGGGRCGAEDLSTNGSTFFDQGGSVVMLTFGFCADSQTSGQDERRIDASLLHGAIGGEPTKPPRLCRVTLRQPGPSVLQG